VLRVENVTNGTVVKMGVFILPCELEAFVRFCCRTDDCGSEFWELLFNWFKLFLFVLMGAKHFEELVITFSDFSKGLDVIFPFETLNLIFCKFKSEFLTWNPWKTEGICVEFFASLGCLFEALLPGLQKNIVEEKVFFFSGNSIFLGGEFFAGILSCVRISFFWIFSKIENKVNINKFNYHCFGWKVDAQL